jgi:hypothetical protein
MKHRLIGALTPLVLLCLLVSPAFGADKPPRQDADFKQIALSLLDAQERGEVVIIGLKNGKTISGKVVGSNDGGFTVRHRLMEFLDGGCELISYADIVSVKRRNPVVKVLKKISAAPAIAVAYVGFVPFGLMTVATRGGK